MAAHSLRFHTARPGEYTRNPSRRYVAAEIEVARCDRSVHGQPVAAAVRTWGGAIVDDGSLPRATGFEINTAPANGDKYCAQISAICHALAQQGAAVTAQCGLHVHVDARDFRYYDLRRLVLVYEKLEQPLFDMVKFDRRGSRFCLPCGARYVRDLAVALRPKAVKAQLLKNVYGEADTRAHFHYKYDPARYYALNLHSWLFRGTVEFRAHHGTVSPEDIQAWGILWASILDYALRAKEAEIAELGRMPELDRLLRIAPTETVKTWIRRQYTTFRRVGAAPLTPPAPAPRPTPWIEALRRSDLGR